MLSKYVGKLFAARNGDEQANVRFTRAARMSA